MDCIYCLLSGNLNIPLKTKKQMFKKYLVILMHHFPISSFNTILLIKFQQWINILLIKIACHF